MIARFCIFVPKVKKTIKKSSSRTKERKKKGKERTMGHLRHIRGTTSTHVVLEGNYFQDNYNGIKENCH